MSPCSVWKMTMAALVQEFRERHTHTPFAGDVPTRGDWPFSFLLISEFFRSVQTALRQPMNFWTLLDFRFGVISAG